MKFKWTAEIEIADCWVMDGFNLTAERLHDILWRQLGYAHGHEIAVRILQAPDPEEIRREQGYVTGTE